MSGPVPRALAPADVEVVWRTPLFAGLPRDAVDSLLSGASARAYDGDTLLFSAGDVAERFFVVVEGSVRLFALDDDGSETIIEIFSAGESFAEAAIFASANPSPRRRSSPPAGSR